MAIENIFSDARTVLTVVSFSTFVGIIWWTYSARRTASFAEAANLPFADDVDEVNTQGTEKRHG